jgi:hypothetical protein
VLLPWLLPLRRRGLPSAPWLLVSQLVEVEMLLLLVETLTLARVQQQGRQKQPCRPAC